MTSEEIKRLVERARTIVMFCPDYDFDLIRDLGKALESTLARLEAAEAVLNEFEKQDFFPLGHGEECLLEEDDHAPDFACTCGTFYVDQKLKAWRSSRLESQKETR